MRWMMGAGVAMVVVVGLSPSTARAGDETKKEVLGVISGLLGGPAPVQGHAGSVAQQQEALAWLLQTGQYVTARQGEPVDMTVLGIPLTRADHVYRTAPPTAAGQPSLRPGMKRCPVGGESYPATYDDCPVHGAVLQQQ